MFPIAHSKSSRKFQLMGIKVHGHPLSPAVQRILLCLAEKELNHEFLLVDLATGQHKKEPFISNNPFGQVPGFEDGDLKLFESRAITRHISHVYANKGTPLITNDPDKMPVLGVWMEVESQRFEPVGQKLSYQILVKPMKGLPTDESAVEQLKNDMAKVLDVYDSRLAESKYLEGDSFTLADLHHIPIINNLRKTPSKALFESRTHVLAWSEDILARPAWKKVLEWAKF